MNDEKDFLDEEEFEEGDEEIITLATPDGEEVDFTQIATVEFEGNLYVIMQPVELFEGMDETKRSCSPLRTRAKKIRVSTWLRTNALSTAFSGNITNSLKSRTRTEKIN